MELKFINHHPPTRDGQDMTFVAVYRWSPTHILKEKRASDSIFTQGTLRNVPNQFTLHSLAPAFAGIYRKSTPQEKASCGHIDFEQFPERMHSKLTKIWPDLIRGKEENFWASQWEAHGVQSGMELYDYFKIPIYIAENIDILEILEQDGIYPDSGVDIYPSQVLNCLTSKLDTTPELYAYLGKKNQYLYEILIRFDLNLKPMPRNIPVKDGKSRLKYRGNFDHSSPVIFKTMSKLAKYM